MARKKERNHYDLKEIENYCRAKTFPKRLPRKGEQPNFSRPQSDFPLRLDNYIICKESTLAITVKDRQVYLIHDIHEGTIDTSHSKSMSAHLGRTPTYDKIAARFF